VVLDEASESWGAFVITGTRVSLTIPLHFTSLINNNYVDWFVHTKVGNKVY